MVHINSTLKTGAILLGLGIASLSNAHAAHDFLSPVSQTNPPIGHYEFCKVNPNECSVIGRDQGPMQLSRKAWDKMLKINTDVNRKIKPLTDMQIHGVEEVWSYPRTVGDCEDYVLLKRASLMKAGFSPADLLITVVLQPDGSGHAVLTVRTDYGDYVLDNLRNDVRLWHETGYRFIKRQSSEHAGAWMKLGNGNSGAVGTTN
ncbi:MAG: transglutaminase-like cysteine peptidase [Lentilitoribacter sp.]